MVLDTLIAYRVMDEGIHPFWHLIAKIDLRENLLLRNKQKAYLARYGRQDFFASRGIVELNSAVRAISEVVQQENEMSRISEER